MDAAEHNYRLRLEQLLHERDALRAHVNELEQAIEEYKFRLHWLNEELLKRGGA